MVKAVIGEESRLRSLEDRLAQSGISVEVGLVIGKLSSILDRGFVFDLIPTPNNDAGDPPASLVGGGKDEKKKGGSKNKGMVSDSVKELSLLMDKDWVAEHARQVSQMLVGGIKVVGIYIWTSDTAFKNSTMELCQTVKAPAQAAPLLANDGEERLLMHICQSPRRWTCRNCSLSSNITSSSLRPCDFKMGRVFNSLQAFRCMYNLDLRLPIFHEDISSHRKLNDILQNAIALHVKELKGSKAVINGNLASDDEPCTSDDLHEVELLLPFMRDTSVEASSEKKVAGILQLTGCVCSYAYLSSKELTSQALDDIKDDIITSLRSRLAIISDEADGNLVKPSDSGTESNDELTAAPSINHQLLQPLGLRKSCIVPLPRRIFIPWMAGTFISNYLQPSETFEVLKDQLVELLSMEPVEPSPILDPETEPLNLAICRSFWDAVASSHPASQSHHSIKSEAEGRRKGSGKSVTSTLTVKNVNSVVAVLVLLLSILAGLMLFSRSYT